MSRKPITDIVELSTLLSAEKVTQSFEDAEEVAEGIDSGTFSERAMETLQHADFYFEDDTVKNHLEEILILLIGVRNGANGKQLIEDVSNVFGTVLSPGTVYPTLHNLDDEDVLTVREHIRTKEYHLKDSTRMSEQIQNKIRQEVVLSFLLMLFDDEVLSDSNTK